MCFFVCLLKEGKGESGRICFLLVGWFRFDARPILIEVQNQWWFVRGGALGVLTVCLDFN